jgi:hypothetical protein
MIGRSGRLEYMDVSSTPESTDRTGTVSAGNENRESSHSTSEILPQSSAPSTRAALVSLRHKMFRAAESVMAGGEPLLEYTKSIEGSGSTIGTSKGEDVPQDVLANAMEIFLSGVSSPRVVIELSS